MKKLLSVFVLMTILGTTLFATPLGASGLRNDLIWDETKGTEYFKGSYVSNGNQVKEVLQDFTTNGDELWWNSTSLFSTATTNIEPEKTRDYCPTTGKTTYGAWFYKVIDSGVHPQNGPPAKVSAYTYSSGNGPQISMNLGYGPVSITVGSMKGVGKTVAADRNKFSKLIVKNEMKTRSYKTVRPCITVTGRQNVVNKEMYYAKYY